MAGAESRDLQTQQATVDSAGYCTFVFSPPPQATIRTGTVSIVDSPAATTWTLYLGASVQGDTVLGLPLATMRGSNVLHAVQQLGNDYLTIQGSGLTPGDRYTCAYHGIVSSAQSTKLVWPVALSQSSAVAVLQAQTFTTVSTAVDIKTESGSYYYGDVEVTDSIPPTTITSVGLNLIINPDTSQAVTFSWFLAAGAPIWDGGTPLVSGSFVITTPSGSSIGVENLTTTAGAPVTGGSVYLSVATSFSDLTVLEAGSSVLLVHSP